MAIIHARLFRLTQEKRYLMRAVQTAHAITDSPHYNNGGVLVNDRDAWANGSFVGDYVREVLVLPRIRPRDIRLIQSTATSILETCRTDNGYYRPEWSGNGIWTARTASKPDPTVPEQVMTSSCTANFVIGAALAGKIVLKGE
ncbi:MAG: hypothetical protein PHR20_08975 [Bacteroidales bacterium]|nr:hypothetical protein [Bacteroidales bacterium]